MMNVLICPICREEHEEPAHAALGPRVMCLECALEEDARTAAPVQYDQIDDRAA